MQLTPEDRALFVENYGERVVQDWERRSALASGYGGGVMAYKPPSRHARKRCANCKQYSRRYPVGVHYYILLKAPHALPEDMIPVA
jgi:hypothetical protein